MVTLGFWVALLGLSVAEVVWGATVSCPEGYASSLSKAGDQCYRYPFHNEKKSSNWRIHRQNGAKPSQFDKLFKIL